MDKHHTHEILHALQLGPRRTQGCGHLWALCDPSQELPRGATVPRAQTSHSMTTGRCAFETEPSQTASTRSHCYFLHFLEAAGKQPPPTHPLGNRLSHRQPPATAQAQPRLLMTDSSGEVSPELNALPQSCLTERDRAKPLHHKLCSGFLQNNP